MSKAARSRTMFSSSDASRRWAPWPSAGFAQPPDAGPQIVEQGFIGRIAPEQRRQLAAGLAAFGAERQIGKKGAFALSRQGGSGAARKCQKLKPAQQAK